jgi:hypothetical protein
LIKNTSVASTTILVWGNSSLKKVNFSLIINKLVQNHRHLKKFNSPVLYSHTHFLVPGIFAAIEACSVVLFSTIIILQRLFKLLIAILLYQMEQTLNVLIKHKKIKMPIIEVYEFIEKYISIDRLILLSITWSHKIVAAAAAAAKCLVIILVLHITVSKF